MLEFVRNGWPENPDTDLKPFYSRKEETSILKGCLLWGSQVAVPNSGREAILNELHVGHPGMSKMKALARMYVWWPGLEKDIKISVKTCYGCQENQANPPGVPLKPWSWPSRPWSRIHIDYAGPFLSCIFLIIIDACSKWIEAVPTISAMSATTIKILQSTFARFGLSKLVVSETGQCFVSEGFKSLSGSLSSRLARTLLSYRTTPHTTTGVTPAELMFGRRPRIRLELVKPRVATDVDFPRLRVNFVMIHLPKIEILRLETRLRKEFWSGSKVAIWNHA